MACYNGIYNGFVIPSRDSYAAQCLRKTHTIIRSYVESAFCNKLIFITLTYDNKHLPTTFKRCQDLPIFEQRFTRKKINTPYGTIKNGAAKHVYITKKSQPLNLKGNKFRHMEILSEQDFKNARFNFMHSDSYSKDFDNSCLLVPQHVKDFMILLRDFFRVHLDDKRFSFRSIVNGEYGEHTQRAHYHILIFDNTDFDRDFYETACRCCWSHGEIMEVDVVSVQDALSVGRVTTYLGSHTTKICCGNDYQREMSPNFCYFPKRQGLGYQVLNNHLVANMRDSVFSPFVRSLSFSLSEWDKKSPVKVLLHDDNGKVYEYEVPRFYKDKILHYLNVDIRTYYVSQCQLVKNIVRDFCKFYGFGGSVDLLYVYYNLGFCADASDVLKYFLLSNDKLKYIYDGMSIEACIKNFLELTQQLDDDKRTFFKNRYKKRHQEQKYIDYCKSKGFEKID